MEFKQDKIDSFLKIFERQKEFIENFNGCKGVKLYKDAEKNNVFYTYSLWESLDDLNAYRRSETFIKTWDEVKKLFSAKPMAFSLQEP